MCKKELLEEYQEYIIGQLGLLLDEKEDDIKLSNRARYIIQNLYNESVSKYNY